MSMVRMTVGGVDTHADQHVAAGSPWVTWRLSSVECSSGPVKTHPRHQRLPIGREPTTKWTASMHLRLPIRVLSASRKTHIAFPFREETLGT